MACRRRTGKIKGCAVILFTEYSSLHLWLLRAYGMTDQDQEYVRVHG